jgi:hypothetical protein
MAQKTTVEEMKPQKRIISLLIEMELRKRTFGSDFPANWQQKTQEKLLAMGYIEDSSEEEMKAGGYKSRKITEKGMAWFAKYCVK